VLSRKSVEIKRKKNKSQTQKLGFCKVFGREEENQEKRRIKRREGL